MTNTVLTVICAGVLAVITGAPYVMENLDRGVSAVKSGNGFLVSWRLLGTEDYATGFNVYKGSAKLNDAPITDRTCYTDNSSGSGDYTVKAVIGGQEQAASAKGLVLANGYLNIPLKPPSGCTANDCSTGDLDGDGQLDLVLKWDADNSKDNSQSGVTGDVYLEGLKFDGTSLWRIDLGPNIRAGAHYTQHIVYDLDGDGKAEVAVKTAPGTKEGKGNYLKTGPASGADNSKLYRNSDGYILSGPEWFTIFDGETGAELATVDYNPPRGNVGSWGDTYGNRLDRYNSTVAYLDGEHPSVVFERGYYTRTTLWAVDWRDGELTTRWFFDGDKYSGYNAQGNHGIMSGDVDQDGRDEIVNGSMCVDDNGKGLWTAGLGHGDAAHLTDIDPDRPGLEVWGIHEDAQVGSALLDAKTGKIIWKTGAGDVGRGVAADLVASSKGLECWGGTSGLRTCTNGSAGGNPSSSNFLCWWDGDLLRELQDGTSISKYGGSTVLSASGCASNNGTKSNPALVADLFGDWREELVLRTSDNKNLRIYSTPVSTTIRLYTLMHDHQYRCQVAEEQSAYNQPPHPGFYLGDGMKLPQEKPDIVYANDPEVGTTAGSRKAFSACRIRGMVPVCGSSRDVFRSAHGNDGITVSFYSLSGKLLGKRTISKGKADPANDLYLPFGMYLVKSAGSK